MKRLDLLLVRQSPIVHRIARHTHDYGLYLSLAIFQKEFLILAFTGATIIVLVTWVQFKLHLEDGKEV